MVEVFISPLGNNLYRIADFGMTLMRLFYYYSLDTPSKQRIFDTIISSYNIKLEKGHLFLEVEAKHLYPALLQFVGVVLKVCNMKLYKREVTIYFLKYMMNLFKQNYPNLIHLKITVQ